MKIGVLLKQVPDTETIIKINSDASGIDEAGVKWVINPYDEYAVEEALRCKEKVGSGEVVVLSVGPARAVESMRQALAMGADKGIRIDNEGVATDSYLIAVALAKAVEQESFDVLFAGKQAVDDDATVVAHGVAQALNWPCVWPVDHVETADDGKSVTVNRTVAGGIKEVVEMQFPGVICCDKGENDPRYASLPGIMKAKSKPIADLKLADLIGEESAKVSVQNYALPPERAAGRKIEGEVDAACDELIRVLREEAKVI